MTVEVFSLEKGYNLQTLIENALSNGQKVNGFFVVTFTYRVSAIYSFANEAKEEGCVRGNDDVKS